MEIFLKRLSLVNFKGIRDLTIDFTGKTTNIYGKNATGKSTIVDAFLWLLFNKNSDDRADFNIKTLDMNNQPIPKIDHTVEALLLVDGVNTELCKTYREKWEVQNGNAVEHFKGHETKYFFDGVPIAKSEYDKRVQSIVMIDIFKLVTNPLYFCQTLKWQDRRKILFDLSPDMTDEDIIAGNEEKFQLMTDVLKKFKLEDYKKKLTSKISKVQEQLAEMPARIDEVFLSMPSEIDTMALKAAISEKEQVLESLDRKLTDLSALFADYNKEQSRVFDLKNQQKALVRQLEMDFDKEHYEIKSSIHNLEREISDMKKYKTSKEALLLSRKELLERKSATRQQLLDKWAISNAETLVFPDEVFICPTCKRSFEAQDVERQKSQMTENFNLKKIETLKDIRAEGQALNEEINKIKNTITSITELIDIEVNSISEKESKLEVLRNQLEKLPLPKPEEDSKYKELQQKIEQIEGALKAPKIDIDEITSKKKSVVAELDALKKELSTADLIRKTEKRIADLKALEKELAITKAEYQKNLQMCEAFTKAKIEAMERSVNGMFKFVSFKLFEGQVNGGERACCEALIDGVPYSDANNSARINAGVDIINTISTFYGVKAPMFIDNRESVNSLIDSDSQIINLFVTMDDKKLRVEAE